MSIDIGLRNVLDYLSNHPMLLVSAFLCYLLFFFISVFFHGQKKGRNPFETDHRRPHEPFVYDHKARDAVIKQRFKASKIPDDLDVIIVGSGVGGLTAGALLSRSGKKCLVLEQHDQAGGCCHSFVEKGFEFDTGIHYIGNMYDGSLNRTLLDQLSCGQLRWAKMDDQFDMVVLGTEGSIRKYPMKSGKERYIQNLVDMFPKEKEAIHKYMDLIMDCAPTFMGIVMLKILPKRLVHFLVSSGLYRLVFKCYRKGYVEKTLQEVLDSLTSDQELKAVLSYIWGDYGVIPKEAPFILHAILVNHYIGGGYYPRNGTSEIAFHLCQVIQKAGGAVLVQAPVSKILCDENGRVNGVQVGKNNEVIQAPITISDAGAINTFKTLLPEKVARKSCIYPMINKVGPSLSFITTFIGVDGDSDELKLPAGNTWLYGSNDLNNSINSFLELNTDELEDVNFPLGYISFPSAKDPEWKHKYPGKSSVLIITVGNWEWFKEWKEEKLRHRGDRYEGIKDSIGRHMWQQCVNLFPQLDGKMEYMEVGTPVSNRYYLACPEGEMYGLDQRTVRFDPEVVSKLRPDTDIPGLFMTGQDTLACGFASALIMGIICASQILNRNLYNDLRNFHKELKAKGTLKSLSAKKIE